MPPIAVMPLHHNAAFHRAQLSFMCAVRCFLLLIVGTIVLQRGSLSVLRTSLSLSFSLTPTPAHRAHCYAGIFRHCLCLKMAMLLKLARIVHDN